MSNVKEVFPKRFKALREAIGVSQDDFAKALGVSRPTISYYEKGDRLPDIDMLGRINTLTECSIEYLVGLADNMKPAYVDIGRYTSLSDGAIDVLEDLCFHADILNFMIEHKDYDRLMNAISLYTVFKTPSYNRMPYLDDKSFAKYTALQIFDKIIDEYASTCPSKEYGDADERYHIREMKKNHEEMDAFMSAPDAFSEEKEEKMRKDFAEYKENHKEKLACDPFYRFRHEMRGNPEFSE